MKAMLFGTFDLLHPGHKNLFRQAKKYANHIIVVVARDKTVKEFKKRKPAHDEKERLAAVKECGLVDEVRLGSLNDKYAVIKKHKPDLILLGYDQKFLIEGLSEKLRELGLGKTEIIRLKPYKPSIYKSSKIRKNRNS